MWYFGARYFFAMRSVNKKDALSNEAVNEGVEILKNTVEIILNGEADGLILNLFGDDSLKFTDFNPLIQKLKASDDVKAPFLLHFINEVRYQIIMADVFSEKMQKEVADFFEGELMFAKMTGKNMFGLLPTSSFFINWLKKCGNFNERYRVFDYLYSSDVNPSRAFFLEWLLSADDDMERRGVINLFKKHFSLAS